MRHVGIILAALALALPGCGKSDAEIEAEVRAERAKKHRLIEARKKRERADELAANEREAEAQRNRRIADEKADREWAEARERMARREAEAEQQAAAFHAGRPAMLSGQNPETGAIEVVTINVWNSPDQSWAKGIAGRLRHGARVRVIDEASIGGRTAYKVTTATSGGVTGWVLDSLVRLD